MKHRSKGIKLNRSKKHRQALITNLCLSLFEHGHIKTTLAKAKATSQTVDKLITTAKKNSIPARRKLARVFGKRQSVNQLVDNVAKQLTTRKSGYTRIVRLGNRSGDDAIMARLELIDYQSSKPTQEKTKKLKKTKPIDKKEISQKPSKQKKTTPKKDK